MKKFAQKNCRKMFLEAIFFAFEKTFFRVFVTALHDIIGLQNFSLSFCQSLSRIKMYNFHWCYTFCTGVTLFALVLHLNCTALSQSDVYYSVCNHTRDKQIGLSLAARSSDFVITCRITDRIGLHSVLLPLLINRFRCSVEKVKSVVYRSLDESRAPPLCLFCVVCSSAFRNLLISFVSPGYGYFSCST